MPSSIFKKGLLYVAPHCPVVGTDPSSVLGFSRGQAYHSLSLSLSTSMLGHFSQRLWIISFTIQESIRKCSNSGLLGKSLDITAFSTRGKLGEVSRQESKGRVNQHSGNVIIYQKKKNFFLRHSTHWIKLSHIYITCSSVTYKLWSLRVPTWWEAKQVCLPVPIMHVSPWPCTHSLLNSWDGNHDGAGQTLAWRPVCLGIWPFTLIFFFTFFTKHKYLPWQLGCHMTYCYINSLEIS